jgi:aspartyl-tRNA(Asn)/glutamyl-tRNA(Gln) amidotransferase subunit A
MSEIEWMGATELVAAYQARTVSPLEVVDHLLARIDRVDPALGAWCLLDPETSRAQAQASATRWAAGEPQGLLDGVPVGVKDIYLTEGWPTVKGSLTIDPAQPWTEDSPSVAALRRHGAVLLGKTTTPEIGWKGVTDSPAAGVTRNPWDTRLTPGGSSGGSAAALAAGMVPLALGTDGGGSIRIPASFSGVCGIKPTWGRVPNWPVSPFGQLAHAGPMARSMADTALLLDVLARFDHRDPGALVPDGVAYGPALTGDVAGLRVGFSADLGYVAVDPEVASLVVRAVEVLAGMGAHVEAVDPGFADPREAFDVLWSSGAAHATRGDTADQRALRDPGLQAICADGATHSAVAFIDATAVRGQLSLAMGAFHQRFDLLVTPTMPIPAFEAGRDVPEGWTGHGWPSWTQFSYPFNMTQQPAASVPCGFTTAGLPVGLQLVGPRGADALVLRAAHAYECARQVDARRPLLQER